MINTMSFDFEGFNIRMTTRSGEPWFVASDVARVLEIGRTDDAVRRLDDDEKGADSIRTPGGSQQLTIINESGLYSLILTSRKPQAKRFRKWVTSVVLPTIRKTGAYSAPSKPAPSHPAALLARVQETETRLLEETRRADEAVKALKAAVPKAAAFDLLSCTNGLITLQNAARSLRWGPRKFIQRLIQRGYLTRQGGVLIPYQQHRKLFAVRTLVVDGYVRTQTFMTACGVAFFAKKVVAA